MTDILTSLASSPAAGIYETVVKQALPPLSNALASAKPEESWVASSAIELVTSLVKGSPEAGIGEGFFALLAPNLFKCLGEAEDRDIIQVNLLFTGTKRPLNHEQNGITCLTIIIRKDCPQLLAWTDANGRGGLDYVLTLVAKLLDSQDESGGLVIGDLIIHLLRRAGEAVLPVLPQLLQAMVSRMTSAKTATFLQVSVPELCRCRFLTVSQSLVIPFAFLINNQRDTVLSLLESMDIQGRSGLNILIQTWCENAETFQGFWPSRISTMALTQLFASERPSLQNLTVKGDIIVKPENKNGKILLLTQHFLLCAQFSSVIMTRSRTKTSTQCQCAYLFTGIFSDFVLCSNHRSTS